MDGIDQFIKQQNQMLHMEKNNLNFLESQQHTLEHAKGNESKTEMVDNSTSVEDDCNEDEEEQQRIRLLGKHSEQTTLATDDDKGKKHFPEQYALSPHSNKVNDQGMHKQSLTDSRNQNYQVYLAEMANKESLEFRRKIGVNEHHDRELQQHEHHDKGKKHFAEQYEQDPHSNEFSDQRKHNQSESDIRHQDYQMYLADEANRDSLEFRRKIGANVQYHHDQELQSDVNQANVRQHDHDNGKKHFAEQYAQSPHSNKFNDQGKPQNESDIRHQEYQVYLAEAANKEAQEFRRKIGASDVQHHHQRHDHELQQQRDVNQVNNRQRDHDRKHGHDQIDIERDIRSSNTKDSHQGLNANLSHYDFSGTKYNAEAVADRNKEQAKVDHRKKMENNRALKKQIEEQKALRERDRNEEKNLNKIAHSQCDQHHQFYPLRQHAHDTPRFTEGGL